MNSRSPAFGERYVIFYIFFTEVAKWKIFKISEQEKLPAPEKIMLFAKRG